MQVGTSDWVNFTSSLAKLVGGNSESLLPAGQREHQRKWRGEGKPETFNFLGFTQLCVKKRSNERFTVLRQTIRKRLQAKLNEVKAELQRRLREPIPKVGKWRLRFGTR
jgi:hypothetical protein